MVLTNRRTALLGALGSVLYVAGCGRPEGTQTSNAPAGAAGEMVLTRGNGGEPASLDQHFTTSSSETNILGDVFLGLTTEDINGQPIPGAAERWEVSEDGLTWTFHLRDHVWSDGMPVTAEDFVYSWKRVLDPKTAAPYALILYDLKNARAINGGKMPVDSLGVHAVDANTLEVQLEHPAPYLAQLMRHMTTLPVPRHVVEAKGKEWSRPENHVSNGAYLLREWRANDHVTLIKNPRFYDAANVRIDRVVFVPINDMNAGFRRYRAGELDTDEALPADQIDWIRANMKDQLHILPSLTSAAVIINEARKPFDDRRVREALNLAYDRDTITRTIMRTGQDPAYSILPPGIANYPGNVFLSFKNMPYPQRVARAKQLMQEAGYGPDRRLKLTFSTGPSQDARRIGAAYQQMLRDIFVDMEISQLDGNTLNTKMEAADFDLSVYAWHADFNDAYNFLFLFLSDNTGLNYAHYKNPKFDALLRQSQQENDLKRRGEILAQAERMLLDDNVWIPTRYEITANLVQPHVKGWTTNPDGVNRTRYVSLERRPERQN